MCVIPQQAKSSARNAQPLIAHYRGRDIAAAHNGNIVNAAELRGQLEEDGAIFQTGNDSEVFMHLLVREMRRHDLPEAVERSCAKLKGAWCFIVLAENTLLAVRGSEWFSSACYWQAWRSDCAGFRNLCL